MEGFPGAPFDLTRWVMSRAKLIGLGALRGFEIFVGAIGALVMLVVIGFFALWDFVLD